MSYDLHVHPSSKTHLVSMVIEDTYICEVQVQISRLYIYIYIYNVCMYKNTKILKIK